MAEDCPFVAGGKITVPILDLETGEHLLDDEGKPRFEERNYGDPVPEAVFFRKIASLVTRGRILLRSEHAKDGRRRFRRRIYRRRHDVMKAVAKMQGPGPKEVTTPETPPETGQVEEIEQAPPETAKKKRQRPRNREEAAKGAGVEETGSGGQGDSAPASED